MPKERVGDGLIKDASTSLTSHSPDCDAQHSVKVIKSEMDMDSVSSCGPSPCSHHGHDMMVGPPSVAPPTNSPSSSMCYSSSPSYSMQDVSSCVQSYSRIAVSSHSPNSNNSIPHPPPSPHHHHMHMSPKSNMSPLYGGGDKDNPHPLHHHQKYSYGAEHHHHLTHPLPPHLHQHIRPMPPSESCSFSGIMVSILYTQQAKYQIQNPPFRPIVHNNNPVKFLRVSSNLSGIFLNSFCLPFLYLHARYCRYKNKLSFILYNTFSNAWFVEIVADAGILLFISIFLQDNLLLPTFEIHPSFRFRLLDPVSNYVALF